LVLLDLNLGGDLPDVFDSTVDFSRVLLSVIAGGTITAASVVFSLTLVAVQLASTQFSPRTLGTFLGDRVQQIIVGIVLGTFAYSLLVLRVVRGPSEVGGDEFIPQFSVMVAVVLGVVSMVAVIASINRSAQSLRVESIARKITAETIAASHDQFGSEDNAIAAAEAGMPDTEPTPDPPSDALVVNAADAGWVQDISVEGMLKDVPEGGYLPVHEAVGSYVLSEQRLVSVWPAPEHSERMAGQLAKSFVIGEQRSRHGDVAFGLTQLDDIAARALSPGINDPKTAEEIVLRLGQILAELAVRDIPPAASETECRTILRPANLQHEDYIELAVEPIRRFARTDPSVLSTLLRTLATAQEVAQRRSATASVQGFVDQRDLILVDIKTMTSQADRDLATRRVASTNLD
jgi:uncharacterized membrane protein